MDNLALHAIVLEFQDRWKGREVVGVRCPVEHHYHFRLGPPGGEHFVVSVHPGTAGIFPTLRTPGPPVPAPGTFPFLLGRVLRGAVLESIEKRFPERQVRLFFRDASWREGRGPAVLMAESIGRSANLILLREDGSIAAAARNLKSAFRRQTPGEPYRDPPVRGSGEFSALGPEEMLRRLRRASGDTSLPAALLESISPLLLEEAKRGVGETHPGRFAQEILRGVVERKFTPVLYLPLPRARLGPAHPLGRQNAFFFPFRLRHAVPLVEERFPTLLEAAEALLDVFSRHLSFQTERRAVRRAVSREWNRVRRLRQALQGDLEGIGDPEVLGRRGEALLAGIASAEVVSGSATVQDPYGSPGSRISIPLPDPGRSLAENAGAYFRKCRKARRAAVLLRQRLREVRPREMALGDLLQEVEALRDEEGLRSMETRLESIGIVRTPSRRKKGPPPPGREFRRLRRVMSPDGWTIYIGRNATDNQYLTFRIAGERDFWLHAADVPGSHVVVRNPSRRGTLPEATLRMAAAAAAFYSGARGSRRVEVHLAFRKDVRKGGGPGQVRLKRFRSVLAEPRDPLAGKPPGEYTDGRPREGT